MNTITFIIIYASIALAVTAHAFYFGVLSQPRLGIFAIPDYGILAIASLAVGLIWILFVPTLAVLTVAKVARVLRSRTRVWSLARTQHASAGS